MIPSRQRRDSIGRASGKMSHAGPWDTTSDAGAQPGLPAGLLAERFCEERRYLLLLPRRAAPVQGVSTGRRASRLHHRAAHQPGEVTATGTRRGGAPARAARRRGDGRSSIPSACEASARRGGALPLHRSRRPASRKRSGWFDVLPHRPDHLEGGLPEPPRLLQVPGAPGIGPVVPEAVELDDDAELGDERRPCRPAPRRAGGSPGW